jgi:hypothetical protein
MPPSTQLRLDQSELNYEGSFVKSAFRLLDRSGRLCDLLLEALESFGTSGVDLVLEDGEPYDRGVACEIDSLDARAIVYGDRIELQCTDFMLPAGGSIAGVIEKLWSALTALDSGVLAGKHSFQFEMNAEILGHSYRDLLNRMAPVPGPLPSQTETAIVYYLPAEPDRGYAESSLVLNRSETVARGLQVNATLVYEGEALKPAEALSAAQSRLNDLLRNLGLGWTED